LDKDFDPGSVTTPFREDIGGIDKTLASLSMAMAPRRAVVYCDLPLGMAGTKELTSQDVKKMHIIAGVKSVGIFMVSRTKS
jgi:hypothetical protein